MDQNSSKYIVYVIVKHFKYSTSKCFEILKRTVLNSFSSLISGARNHHRQHHHNVGPHHQLRGGGNGYQPPKFYDPYEIYNLLPPPEYLRNMPPPAMPIPKLPCLEPYNNENNGGMGHQGPIRGPGFYPPFPAHWRPAVPPPPPPPQPHVYRGRPPMQQPPMMVSHMTSTRHFR